MLAVAGVPSLLGRWADMLRPFQGGSSGPGVMMPHQMRPHPACPDGESDGWLDAAQMASNRKQLASLHNKEDNRVAPFGSPGCREENACR